LEENKEKFTVAGTNIDEVKRKNAESGLSYNEVKALLASTGGLETSVYSNTDVEEVKKNLSGNEVE